MFFIQQRTEELIKSESCSTGFSARDDDTWVDIYQTCYFSGEKKDSMIWRRGAKMREVHDKKTRRRSLEMGDV